MKTNSVGLASWFLILVNFGNFSIIESSNVGSIAVSNAAFNNRNINSNKVIIHRLRGGAGSSNRHRRQLGPKKKSHSKSKEPEETEANSDSDSHTDSITAIEEEVGSDPVEDEIEEDDPVDNEEEVEIRQDDKRGEEDKRGEIDEQEEASPVIEGRAQQKELKYILKSEVRML